MNTYTLFGNVLFEEDFAFVSAEITVENGIIKEIAQSNKKSDTYIIPAFFNAHTHIADTVAMDTRADRPLAELVAPPNGVKHKILASAPDEELVRAMKHTADFMKRGGTLGFADFREGGTKGVELLKRAVPDDMSVLILGREGGEFICDGLGLSNARNRPGEEKMVEDIKKAGKLFAVHAGEANTDDIDTAFALEPDFIVHAVNFSKKHIKEAADKDIPLVLCPRSNWILGATNTAQKPPVKEMIEAGCRIYLGTDNVMFVEPDMFKEAAFMYTVYKMQPEDVLRAATQGFSLAGIENTIRVGNKANLTVLKMPYESRFTKDPLLSVFMRSGRASCVCSCKGDGPCYSP